MKTATKVSLGLVILIILAIGGATYYLLTNLDALVKAAIEKYGTEVVKTSVKVDTVHIGLKAGTGTIQGLRVANPPGFSATQAFTLGEIHTRINTDALVNKKIVIDEVRVSSPQLVYELNAEKQGNLNILKDNLGVKSKTNVSDTKSQQASPAKTLTLTIKRIILQDAQMHATLVPLNHKEFDLKVPSFELTNLSGTPDQITRQIMSQLLDHAKEALQQSVVGQEIARLKGEAQQRIEERKAELKAKADEKIDAEKQKLQDKLKGLLNR